MGLLQEVTRIGLEKVAHPNTHQMKAENRLRNRGVGEINHGQTIQVTKAVEIIQLTIESRRLLLLLPPHRYFKGILVQ